MTKVDWYSVEKDGLPKAIDSDVSLGVLLCVEGDYAGGRTIQFGFYSHHDKDWYTLNGDLIWDTVAHWADAPSLPEVD